MKNTNLRNAVVAALATLSFSTSAHALNWVLSPDANAMAFGVTVVTGTNQIALNAPAAPASGDTQPAGIFGAGFTYTGSSFSMEFDADLYTWDSYSAYTGGNTGYYDGFIVTVSTSGYYWQTGHTDPIPTGAGTWVWGGQTYGDALESYVTAPGNTDSISLNAGNATYYVSLVLDTKTTPYTDTNYPSWGSFHVTPVPEPEIYAMMVAGLGLMGFVARRRKQQTA